MMATRSRACLHLTGLGEQHITRILNDRISRAYLMAEGDPRNIAMDTNAHLVTELREAHIWPTRPITPPDQDDA